MLVWIEKLNPVSQALLATIFTWGMTAAGAAQVFFFRSISRKIMDPMLGFAAGVMLAASFWSLLAPAVALSRQSSLPAWLVPAIGFLAGGFFLRLVDKLLPHLHPDSPTTQAEGLKTTWQRSILLVLAITLHNIPEGLAVGVSFGAAGSGLVGTSLSSAISLSLGIGLQNYPEGAAVALPLRREGLSAGKSFWFGQLSGLVEPLAAVFGAAAVLLVKPLLPYALSFAAGAMVFVVVEELIPESQTGEYTDLATLGTIAGFVTMMVLDIAFS
ncbi:MAG: ZIP family metal transporter [Candidatus Omnitrophica bacterium]|nr:ZIP family metal transporter [Candidatus Omnitrophota bacterium]